MTRTITLAIGILVVAGLVGCAGSGRTTVSYGVGYGGYYGPSPWGYRRPVYVVGGGDPGIPDIPDGPVAAPMPDFGMPDAGGMDDFGGFDF